MVQSNSSWLVQLVVSIEVREELSQTGGRFVGLNRNSVAYFVVGQGDTIDLL